MVLALDIAAREIFEDRLTNADEVAVLQLVVRDGLVIDEGAVGGVEIMQPRAPTAGGDLCVLSRNAVLLHLDVGRV